jgi:nicotinamidase/pyrazinamidase
VIQVNDRDQVLWPPHCVQETENARILIDTALFETVIRKGQDKAYDSYSGFQDDGGHRTRMDDVLKRDGIEKVVVYGIATDYCVRATALDAVQAGYEVVVITDLCRGVDPDTSATALEEMENAGVTLSNSFDEDLIRES